MTSHAETNPEQGWNIVPANDRIELQQTEAGRFSLPMASVHNDVVIAHISVVFTGGQIEEMYRQMRQLHSAEVAAFGVEDRRQQKADMGRVF